MSQKETILAILERGRPMLRRHLADFTDAEMLHRPAPSANHAAWQLAHLLKSSLNMARAISPAADVVVSDKIPGVNKELAKSDDPADFPTKEELIGGHEAVVTAMADAIGKMSDADLDGPVPEAFHRVGTTVAQLAMMVPLHQSMHVGQFQVIRRSLGKPVLF